MANILDLRAYQEETADITLAGGQVLHLRKPTQQMVIHMLELRDVDEKSDPRLIMSTLDRLTAEILNCNADGVTFAQELVSPMSTDAKLRICKAYSDWAVELQSNPTTSPRPSRESKRERKRGNLRKRFMPWRNTRA